MPAQQRFELGGFEADRIEIRLSRGQLLYSKTMKTSRQAKYT